MDSDPTKSDSLKLIACQLDILYWQLLCTALIRRVEVTGGMQCTILTCNETGKVLVIYHKRAVSYFEIQALEGDSGSQQEAQSPEPTPVQSFVEGCPARHHDLSLVFLLCWS